MADKGAMVRSGRLFTGAHNALLFRLPGANYRMLAANNGEMWCSV